jgi:hypothetical protein
MPKNYSVECAQPYENSGNYEAFAVTLRGLLQQIHQHSQTASIVLLVDDVTYPRKDFNFDKYASWLRENGFEPDFVARESQITEACDKVLQAIDVSKLKPELAVALQSEEKYISQLFIASWCLVRLGHIRVESFSSELQAERLVNILPTSFKPGEDESLEIIRATPYGKAAENIDYIFVPE